MQYELFYLVGERQEANLDAIKKGVNDILVSGKASLLEPELSEKRKLAYEIKHQAKGVYITRRFDLPGVDEMDESIDKKEFGIESITKKLNLFNDVLRFLIVKTEDLPDLGAKERRKTQEMSAQKQATTRPQQQRPQAIPKKSFEAKGPARDASHSNAGSNAGGDAKNIDEQLDKLLDI